VTVGGGVWKGRTLRYPDDRDIRPTMQRTKESVFSSLGPLLGGAVFVDLYAGAGATGIEALSRGARRVHFVEIRRDAVALLRANLEACGADPARYAIHEGAVLDAVSSLPCPFADATLMVADPPYALDANDDFLGAFRADRFPALLRLVVEHRAKQPIVAPAGLVVERERRFGDTMLTTLVPAPDARAEAELEP
jgi:16S rRNA (guanine966-N2)-methyltransferase